MDTDLQMGLTTPAHEDNESSLQQLKIDKAVRQRDILAKALKVITSPSRVTSDEHARRVAKHALADAKLT